MKICLASSHVARFADKFMATPEASKMGVFGAVNVGEDASWWDYGQLRLYRTNNLLLTHVSSFDWIKKNCDSNFKVATIGTRA